VAQHLHSAAFVVRAWWEDGSFRARITYTTDIGSPQTEETQVVTANIDDVQQHLATWLAKMIAVR
jgi:hypothetical protein